MTQGLGILEFPKIRHCGNSVIASEAKQSLGILDFYPRNSRIPYYVILGLDPRISIWNSRILCDEIPRSSRGMTQGLGILEFPKLIAQKQLAQ